MARLFTTATATVVALGLLTGCPDSDDDPSAMDSPDAGFDAQVETPSVKSIDFEGAAPATAPQRIHIESSQRRGVISESPPLEIGSFLAPEVVTQFLGVSEFDSYPIPGQDISTTYNGLRYSSAPDEFGIGLQVWDLSDADETPQQRLEELRGQFLNVDDHSEAPPQSFTSRRAGIRTVVFAGENTPHLFILSCSREICQDWDDLASFSARLASQN